MCQTQWDTNINNLRRPMSKCALIEIIYFNCPCNSQDKDDGSTAIFGQVLFNYFF